MFDQTDPNQKMLTNDRILVLKPKEGLKAKNSIGLTDPRLFTGENKLHVTMDTGTCLWSMHYDIGVTPKELKNNRYTSFSKALDAARRYYDKRNIEIPEVIE